ncbi:hypothetical protein [Flammeovirga aprica]|uniref:Uncharacterized protein n=1 Tax=Flammeovirga aprica JL-4 TaxID=694437 RepID=A0A7X9RZR6_9BACT|nr:hypothetical protein [Flammeovirga aprica]NME71690.1 hypothetical protein [Flammeovirga aprica JL-4]
MRTTFYTLLSLLLASCSLIDYNIEPENLEVHYNSPEALLLKPYVDNYLQEASKRGIRLHHKTIDINVEMGNEKEVLAKACFFCRKLTVYNNSKLWDEMKNRSFDVNYGGGMKVLAHELNHTLIDADHRGIKGETMTVILDGQKEEAILSIMTQGDNDIPDLTDGTLSFLWEEYYWDELFEIIPTENRFVVE